MNRLYLVRSKSYFEHTSKFTGCMDANGLFLREMEDFVDNVKALIMAGNEGDAEVLIRAKYEAVKEKVNAGGKSIKEALAIAAVGMAYIELGNWESVKSIVGMVSSFLSCTVTTRSSHVLCLMAH